MAEDSMWKCFDTQTHILHIYMYVYIYVCVYIYLFIYVCMYTVYTFMWFSIFYFSMKFWVKFTTSLVRFGPFGKKYISIFIVQYIS